MPIQRALSAALKTHGLHLRGGFCPRADQALSLPDGIQAAVLWMAGNVGGSMWDAFQASELAHDGLPHALDRWSRQVGDALATAFGGVALYPFDGPPAQPQYHPFQRWAERCEAVFPSPMMLRIHPQFGLWHAYRFALAFTEVDAQDRQALDFSHGTREDAINPCLLCDGQPCLQTCPVDAYDGVQFAAEKCRTHVRSEAGQACQSQGCLARNSCSVAPQLRYGAAQAQLHMAAFVQGRG